MNESILQDTQVPYSYVFEMKLSTAKYFVIGLGLTAEANASITGLRHRVSHPTEAQNRGLETDSFYVVCGQNDSSSCAGQSVAALSSTGHEVRCCSDTDLGSGWRKRSGCNVWGESEIEGVCYDNETHQIATNLCEDVGARLCTRAELLANCAAGSGCAHDSDLVWSSTPAGLTPSPAPPSCLPTVPRVPVVLMTVIWFGHQLQLVSHQALLRYPQPNQHPNHPLRPHRTPLRLLPIRRRSHLLRSRQTHPRQNPPHHRRTCPRLNPPTHPLHRYVLLFHARFPQPTSDPTSVPSPSPTNPPTTFPTNVPSTETTVATSNQVIDPNDSFYVVCGRNDSSSCAGQSVAALSSTGHEVRCCSDTDLGSGWRKRSGCDVWGESEIEGVCYDNETH
ncbi:hypothetical protein ACHAWF_018468 [Thalassiosira exigua]